MPGALAGRVAGALAGAMAGTIASTLPLALELQRYILVDVEDADLFGAREPPSQGCLHSLVEVRDEDFRRRGA